MMKKTLSKTISKPKKKKIQSRSSKKTNIKSSTNIKPTDLNESLPQEKIENIGTATIHQEISPVAESSYSLPSKYGSNELALLPRDPWWLYTYWDISQQRIDEVVSSIGIDERQDLRWALRIYDVSGIKKFIGSNANSFFDLDINFEAGNWYININQPEREWCVEIGFKNSKGNFFAVARSNIIKSPYFGISSRIDEEWVLPDDEYFRVLGIYDLGKSSLERQRKFEEIVKRQISSPLASWGISSLYSERIPQQKDKFFLEVATEVILYGRTEPDAEVTIEGKKVELKSDGTFSLRYALPVGDFQFEVVGTSNNKKYKIRKVPAVKRYDK
jgi:hypothetical protein